jgi:hypothetical protein
MTRRRAFLTFGAVAGCALLAFAVAWWWTKPQRDALRVFTAVLGAANAGDLDEIRRLCTADYLRANPPALAEEGGVRNFPRGIHKNFGVWDDGPDVLICPTNRIGPVYRIRHEGGAWRFDGLAGEIRRDRSFVPVEPPR